jgi:hypothetical protein
MIGFSRRHKDTEDFPEVAMNGPVPPSLITDQSAIIVPISFSSIFVSQCLCESYFFYHAPFRVVALCQLLRANTKRIRLRWGYAVKIKSAARSGPGLFR